MCFFICLKKNCHPERSVAESKDLLVVIVGTVIIIKTTVIASRSLPAGRQASTP